MKFLPLLGILLLCLLQEGHVSAFYNPFQRLPYRQHVPFINPFLNPYYQYSFNHQPKLAPMEYSGISPFRSPHFKVDESDKFDRGNVESVPFRKHADVLTYKYAEDEFANENQGLPSRAAVEHIPIEGAMNILVRSAHDVGQEEEYEGPFSRGSVEAFPSVASPYAAFSDDDINAVVVGTSSQNFEANYPLIGTRSAVESPPASPNTPFTYFRGSQYSEVDAEAQWNQLNAAEIRPITYNKPAAGISSNLPWKHNVPYFERSENRVTEYRTVCYFESWAYKRKIPMNFDIKNIDPFSCSHLIYSFAGLNKQNHTIESLDKDKDITRGGYKEAVALKQKNPNLKVLIAIGGWAEGGNSYSKMVSSPKKRAKFVASVDEFISTYGFDGLDLDWEYPGSSDRGGRHSDKKNVLLLCQELKKVFEPKELLLTMAVPIAESRITVGYDIAGLSKCLDFFNLMAYDLRGSWDGYADHHAPLSPRSTDKFIHRGLNIEDGVQLFINEGSPRKKLVLGMPLYGRSFTLQKFNETLPGSKIKYEGNAGRYTEERGYISFFEVCINHRNGGWTIKKDEAGGVYMFKGDQWIGYDDEKYIEEKVKFVKREQLGGAMVWALDLDDYLGMCGTRWPLMTTIRRVLLRHESDLGLPQITAAPTTTASPTTLSSTTAPSITEPPASSTTQETTKTTEKKMETTTFKDNPKVTTVQVKATPKPNRGQKPRVESLPGASCTGSGFVRRQGDCQKFLICNQGKYMERKCPQGLLWNAIRKLCDWPKNVNCDSAQTPSEVDHSAVPTKPVEPSPPVRKPEIPSSIVELEQVGHVGRPLSGDFKVVCYFTNWAWYRPGIGKYSPDNIDPTLCTHIVYGFAVLDYTNLVIKPHDSWADVDNGFFRKVTDLKKRGIKVSIAIGGWNDSEGDKYSRLVNNPTARAKFITHVIAFIKKYNFDGLDLDWEYPVCWQVKCEKGPASDKDGFSKWVKELNVALKKENLLLSAAVSPSKTVIDKGYNVPVLSNNLDWIAVMAYDFHGHWDKKTGHVAPMYYHPDDEFDFFNMDFAIRYYINLGADKRKLILGMPLYGQAFTLNTHAVHGLNAPANLKGQAGQFTRAAGFLAYYEICHNIKEGWNVVKDPQGRMGPYAYNGNQWVSYDDVDTIRKKSQYIRDNGLGGGMVWALDLDDFTNRCGQGRHPLMNTIKSVLGPKMKPRITDPAIAKPMPEITVPEIDHIPVLPEQVPSEYKVVCYFTNWAWYRPGEGKYLPDDIDPSLCTHINYGFAVLDPNTLTIKPHDTWADIDNNFYHKIVAFKKQGVKVLIAIGGWNDSEGSKYSRLANSPSARSNFNNHVLKFIQKYDFDGLDLDWEYPKCWQVACEKGPASDKTAFTEWIRELSELFKPHGLLLTAAVSPSSRVIKQAYDVPALSKYLNFINVMAYDYHGKWDKMTGHVAPMWEHPDDVNRDFNTDYTINFWIDNGADPKKIILGMPMYGQSFTLKGQTIPGLNKAVSGGGKAGQYTRAKGFLAYYEICYNIINHGWTVKRDPLGTMGPFAYKGNQWIGFDDVPQIRMKSQYIKSKGLGGGMIWALDLDDFNNRCGCERYPLLKTINRELRNYHEPDPNCPILGEVTVIETPVIQAETPVVVPPEPVIVVHPEPSVIIPPQPPIDIIQPQQPIDIQPRPQIIKDTKVGETGKACISGGFKNHLTDCSKFFECYEGKLREVKCYPGGHWDGKRACRPPAQAKCKNRFSEPTFRPVAVVSDYGSGNTVSDMDLEGAKCKPGEYRRHLECNKFYECLHSKLRVRTCFPGLEWNGKGRCTWPQNANCRPKPKPLPPVQLPPVQSPPVQEPSVPIKIDEYPVTQATTLLSTQKRATTPDIPVATTYWTTYPTTPSTTTVSETTTNRWYVRWTPSTIPTTPKPTHPPGSLETQGYKVVCYFTNWAWYRQGIAKYKPSDIDARLCTHILYGFAVLDINRLLIKPHDTWADYDNSFYEHVTGIKKYGTRVILALGGWNDSKGGKYSKLVNNPAARREFTKHVVQFIEKHNFDGLDLDWEYPKCWQVDCSKGPDSDKAAFTAWIRELKAALAPKNLLLTAAVSPSYKVIDAAYDVPALNEHLDFINVMAYDYHGHWDKQTGHVAPLYHHPDSNVPEFNANYTMNYWISKGADRKKLIMGMPLYGQAFTLKNPANTGLNSPASKGRAGEFTRAAGFLAYYEICNRVINQGYTLVKDPTGAMGPYAYLGNQWVGFDDADMIERKAKYIMEMSLGGAMVWALDLDDFNNRCGCEPHPLLRTIRRTLKRDFPEPPMNCNL